MQLQPPLPPEWAEVARSELHETPDPYSTLQLCEKLLHKVRKKEPELNPNPDPNFLVRFLRARKFDLGRARELLLNYYEFRYKEKELFADLTPERERHVYATRLFSLLPGRDARGRKVFLLRPGMYDPDCFSVFDAFRAATMVLETAIKDPVTQVSGIAAIVDFEGYGQKQLKHFSIRLARLIVTTLQDTVPLRFKSLFYLNTSPTVSTVVQVMKQLLPGKLVSRVRVLSADDSPDWDLVTAEFGRDVLPAVYGGNLQSEDHFEHTLNLVMSHQEYFEHLADFGFPEDRSHWLDFMK